MKTRILIDWVSFLSGNFLFQKHRTVEGPDSLLLNSFFYNPLLLSFQYIYSVASIPSQDTAFYPNPLSTRLVYATIFLLQENGALRPRSSKNMQNMSAFHQSPQFLLGDPLV